MKRKNKVRPPQDHHWGAFAINIIIMSAMAGICFAMTHCHPPKIPNELTDGDRGSARDLLIISGVTFTLLLGFLYYVSQWFWHIIKSIENYLRDTDGRVAIQHPVLACWATFAAATVVSAGGAIYCAYFSAAFATPVTSDFLLQIAAALFASSFRCAHETGISDFLLQIAVALAIAVCVWTPLYIILWLFRRKIIFYDPRSDNGGDKIERRRRLQEFYNCISKRPFFCWRAVMCLAILSWLFVVLVGIVYLWRGELIVAFHLLGLSMFILFSSGLAIIGFGDYYWVIAEYYRKIVIGREKELSGAKFVSNRCIAHRGLGESG